MILEFLARMAIRPTKYLWILVKQANHAVWETETKEGFGHCGKGVHLTGFSTFISPANIHIGNNVHIGDGAIIGLGTIVTNDVPSLAIVGGHGQRIIGYRDRAHYELLEQQGDYGGQGGGAMHV